MHRFRLFTIALIALGFVTGLFAQTTSDELDSLLEAYVADDDPAVVILISTPDMTWVGAQGLADIENELMTTPDDRFRIGSITKMFVSTVVLQLSEEGILDLDDPISEWLPEDIIENVENADQATIRQLLNMSSGILDYLETDSFWDAVDADPEYPWTAAETIEFIYGEPANFSPGEDFSYSNSNYNLLQIIIETATDSSLADILEERIFEPVGMDNSYLESPQAIAEGIVQGYGADLENVTTVNEGVGLGDGGIISTVQDMELFARALFEGDLLSDTMFDEMLDVIEDGEGDGYGLGIGTSESDFGEIWGHDGATAGFLSVLMYLPEYETVVIGLTNYIESDVLSEVAFEILYAVLDE